MTLPIINPRKDSPHLIYKIPMEFLSEFTTAPYEAMRDLLAIPAVVKDALFPNPRVLEERVDKTRKDPIIEDNLYQWINSKVHSPKGYNIFNEHLIPPDNNAAYFMHIDLAITEDSTGVSLVHRDPKTGRFVVDFIFAVESCKIVEKRIPIGKMKYIAIYLKYNLGYNISKVTYDGFQSAESIQELVDNGIDAKIQSVDRTPAPYDTLRDLIHSDQISFYAYASDVFKTRDGKSKNMAIIRELLNLTKDTRTGKVDHITKGSKDVADALCGALFICASENFEYQGVNDFTLEAESSSEITDPYIYDGYRDEEISDIKEIQSQQLENDFHSSDEDFDNTSKFYGDEF